MHIPEISVIVRTHKIERLSCLRRAILSLSVQKLVKIEMIISAQRFSTEKISLLKEVIDSEVGTRSAIFSYKIINTDSSDKHSDLRVELLNNGIKEASCRYIAFLDDDDLMYHFAYSQLIDDLELTKAAIAFGRCVRVEGIEKNGIFYPTNKKRPYVGSSKLELIIDNFCPIHSYVIDRNVVLTEDLFFDDLSYILEDYRLLLRLASKYKFTFMSMEEDICEYWFYDNDSNTTSLASNRFSSTAREWRKAYSLTQEMKSEMNIELNFLDFELWARTRLQDLNEKVTGRRGPFSDATDVTIDKSIEHNNKIIVSGDILVKKIRNI